MINYDIKLDTGDSLDIELKNNLYGDKLIHDDCIFRYMNFEKFVHFITNGLYLTRVDFFDDRFEGDYTETIYKTSELIDCNGVKATKSLHTNKQYINRSAYASCWALGETESMAHWDIYGGGKNSVAIKTSIGKLIKELEFYNYNNTENTEVDRRNIIIQRFSRKVAAKISYIDYYKQSIDIAKWHCDDYLNRLLSKHHGYAYENEARILYDFSKYLPTSTYENGSHMSQEIGSGFSIPVNSKNLLTSVIVSPRADAWFFDVINNILISNGFFENSLNDILKYSEFRHSPSEKSA